MVYELLNGTYGQIDFGLCAEAINKTTMETASGMGVAIGAFLVISMLMFFAWAYFYNENKTMKDYLRRRNGLNDYETWKKDRKLE